MRQTRRSLLAQAGLLQAGLIQGGLFRAGAARAEALAQPTGRVILTISGQIANRNSPEGAQFDVAMLEALGTRSFTTTTPWYPGPQTFEGVPMARLLQVVGARGTTVTAQALNDYGTDIPFADFETFPVLLALKRDGNYMPVRDKGPLFIVYPFDSDPALKHQQYYSRSAWQVARLIVK
jgi:hypothetical protein